VSIGIILTPDCRSKAYIQKCIKQNIMFEYVIFMNDSRDEKQYNEDVIKISLESDFDISESVKDTLIKNKIDFKEFSFVNINDVRLIEHIKKLDCNYWIFSGGGILKNEILSLQTKFIHLHPGIVPKYRGSTCFYYSILNGDEVGVTCFVMNEGIDTGNIVLQKTFSKPNHVYLDEVFDPHIRSETLLEMMKCEKNMEKSIIQDVTKGETYYIIHPVLKHIAILKCINY
jgi:methionyl-tRNA formyltransferase|tara:strand:- start:193 stop:879 length:687 start_codon:yes stop_codon:yes gene_type:complete